MTTTGTRQLMVTAAVTADTPADAMHWRPEAEPNATGETVSARKPSLTMTELGQAMIDGIVAVWTETAEMLRSIEEHPWCARRSRTVRRAATPGSVAARWVLRGPVEVTMSRQAAGNWVRGHGAPAVRSNRPPTQGIDRGKLARAAGGPATYGPVQTTGERTVTAQGGDGWARDAKGELFLLALTHMVSEKTFYEAADDRDVRFVSLVHKAVAEDADWVARFIPWLRSTANMRTASVVAAAEYAWAVRNLTSKARDAAPTVRSVVSGALQRPDEPGEFCAYWLSGRRSAGRNSMPSGVQRGVADAVARLYDERAALKYDGLSQAYRLGDVVELVRPTPSAEWQGDLFRYLLDRRHHGDGTPTEALAILRARAVLDQIPQPERADALRSWGAEAAERLRAAGMTWEALAGWLGGPMDAVAWMFPLRFLSAYKTAPSLRWAYPLEQAVQHSLANVPALPGRTLVLVDQSGSMASTLSDRSSVRRSEAAALFGFALGLRAEQADVYVYGAGGGWGRMQPLHHRVDLPRAASVLPLVKQYGQADMGGTLTWTTFGQTYDGHDRVVIVTDEQAQDSPRDLPRVPVVTFNVAGYSAAHTASGPNRVTVGGLTDAGFAMLGSLDARHRGEWPF